MGDEWRIAGAEAGPPLALVAQRKARLPPKEKAASSNLAKGAYDAKTHPNGADYLALPNRGQGGPSALAGKGDLPRTLIAVGPQSSNG